MEGGNGLRSIVAEEWNTKGALGRSIGALRRTLGVVSIVAANGNDLAGDLPVVGGVEGGSHGEK